MYDKLVNRLRKAAGPAIDFPDTLYDEAADAIEELDNLLNLYRQGKIRRPNNDLPTSAKRGGDVNT